MKNVSLEWAGQDRSRCHYCPSVDIFLQALQTTPLQDISSLAGNGQDKAKLVKDCLCVPSIWPK